LWAIYDSLIHFDKDMNPQPGLAKSWTWPSPTQLRLELIEGNRFHDGTPFDAEAVRFNLDRIRAGGAGIMIASDLAAVQSVEVPSPTTVNITLSRPNASLLLTLSDRAGMMVSPTALQQDADAVERTPVGAGAFKFDKWTPGDRIDVSKADTYWDTDATKLSGISFRLMPDPQTRLNALRAGDIDFIYEVDPESFSSIEHDAALDHQTSPTLAYYQLFFDMSRKPFYDRRVRQAIAMSINRTALVNAVLGPGGGEPAWMPMPADHWAYTPALEATPSFDTDKARQLLASAGHADGFTFEMAFENGALNERRAEIIKSSLADVGITVNLKPNDTASTTSAFVVDKTVDVLNSRWTGRPDPATTYFGEFAENGFTNVGRYVNPALDKALQDGEATPDQAARKAAYATANEILIDEAFNVPLYFQKNIVVYNKRVQGFEGSLLGKPRFDGVSLSGS
jgi:ABC-type transport system substrate-binding protein